MSGFRDNSFILIDAKRFVAWLLALESRQRMPRLNRNRAFGVSRFLSEKATAAQDPNMIEELARAVWMLGKFHTTSPSSSEQECRDFLRDFKPYLLNHNLDEIARLLDGLRGKHIEKGVHSSNTSVEFRPTSPVPFVPTSYVPRHYLRKWPSDDLTERISIADSVLHEAQCRRIRQVIGDALRAGGRVPASYCTAQHIGSRLGMLPEKFVKTVQRPWINCYWDQLDPKNASRAVEFKIQHCDC